MDVGDEDAVAVLDFLIKTIVKVFHPPFRLAQAHGGIVVFVDDFFDKDGETAGTACVDLRSRGAFCLALDLCFGTASRALWRTSRHPDLLCLPVDLGVMLAKPGKTEDHVLFAQRCDRKLGSLCMAVVAQYDVCDFGDSTCFVGSSIDVVDGDGSGEATGGEVVQADILSVDEKPGSTTVDERAHAALHRSVRRLNFDVNMKGVLAWSRCDDEFLRQTTFPVGEANSRYLLRRGRGLGHDFHTIEYTCSILTLIYY